MAFGKFQMAAAVAAVVGFSAVAAHAAPVLLFSDDFNGGKTSDVPGWTEYQSNSWSVFRESGYMILSDEISGNPDAAARTMTAIDGTGYENIVVKFRWGTLKKTEKSDDLHFGWSGDPAPAMSDQNAWNNVWESGDVYSGTEMVTISPGADNSKFNLWFWTDVSAKDEGYGIDYVKVYGEAIAAVPVPASGLLLVGGLGAVAALRRRKARS